MIGKTNDALLRELQGVRRYALALTRDEQTAADLIQDCLERALQRQHLFEPGTNLRSWLFTIMHNIFVDQRRQAARRGPHVPLDAEGCELAEAPRQSMSCEMLDFQRAFYKLSHEHQEVMVLVCVEGFTYEEVATITGISLGTVKSRLFRARERLRELLKQGAELPPRWVPALAA